MSIDDDDLESLDPLADLLLAEPLFGESLFEEDRELGADGKPSSIASSLIAFDKKELSSDVVCSLGWYCFESKGSELVGGCVCAGADSDGINPECLASDFKPLFGASLFGVDGDLPGLAGLVEGSDSVA